MNLERWRLCRAIEASGGLLPENWHWLDGPPFFTPHRDTAYILGPECGPLESLAAHFPGRPLRLLLEPATPRQSLQPYYGQHPQGPWLLLVGDAAGPNAWEQRPLYGMRLVLTREASQAEPLERVLSELGADVTVCPLLRFDPPDDEGPLRQAQEQLESYNWVVFTSPNGVRRFFDGLAGDGRRFAGTRIACIGPGTAATLSEFGLHADVVPERSVAEGLLEALTEFDFSNARVLLPRAQEARAVLPEGLRARGAVVDVVPCYKTVLPQPPKQLVEADRVVVMSSSSVRHLRQLSEADLPLLCIGPITEATARELGFSDILQADQHHQDGVVQKLLSSRADDRAQTG